MINSLDINCRWSSPPQDLVLANNELHIWHSWLDKPPNQVKQLGQLLSPDETERAERFHFEKDRLRFTVCRGILRTILGLYLDMEPEQLQFIYGERGKPGLAGNPLHFNLSHAQGVAIYGITRNFPLGIDVEGGRTIKDAEQIAKRFFSPREYQIIKELESAQKQKAFLNCWTRKEAYLKATGEGLAGHLEKIEVSLAPGEPAKLISIDGDESKISGWWLQEIMPGEGYVGAVAVRGEIDCVKQLTVAS